MGVCHPVLQILTPFSDQKCHFHTPFQKCPLKYISVFQPGGLTNATHVSLGNILSSYQEPITLKSISKSHITLTLFLIHLELKRQIRSCTPVVPWKTMPVIPDQNRQSLYNVPVFRSNGAKIIPFFIYFSAPCDILCLRKRRKTLLYNSTVNSNFR